MVVPVLPHEVKACWGYFAFSRTQLPVLCVYVEGTICRDNDLECSAVVLNRGYTYPLGVPNTATGGTKHQHF